jgi:type II protein arginine methyltransferase
VALADDPLYQAFEHFQAGRLENAADFCRRILAHHPDHPGTNHLLGVTYFKLGRLNLAVGHLALAAASPEANAEVHTNHGAVLDALGRRDEAIAAFKRALALDANYVLALNNLGVALKGANRSSQAVDVLRQAAALQPDLALAQTNLRAAYSEVVPAWHFAMVNDRPRNDAYESAIRRMAAGKRVLDIGTGTGLLAMMAARAGAKSVVSCETVSLIAERARDIVALNGLSDKITVIGKRSTDLVVGRDMAERAQVLITEIFSSSLINEGVLPSIEHAYDHLLTADAITIPSAASAMGYLIGGGVPEDLLFMGKVNGFDLSPFNNFAPSNLAVDLDARPHLALSDDIELLRFEMKARSFPMGSRPLNVTVARPGTCAGVAQWIRLELDDRTRYENRPARDADRTGHWTHYLYRFPELATVEAGDVLRLNVWHNRSQINVDLIEIVRASSQRDGIAPSARAMRSS